MGGVSPYVSAAYVTAVPVPALPQIAPEGDLPAELVIRAAYAGSLSVCCERKFFSHSGFPAEFGLGQPAVEQKIAGPVVPWMMVRTKPERNVTAALAAG